MVIDFQILANDEDITDKVKALGSYSISITDTVGDNADGFSIRLADSNDELVFPQNSTRLQVQLGYEDNLRDFGYFFVSDTKYSLSKGQGAFIDIVASSVPFTQSLTYKSMQTAQERTFENQTVGQIVELIAQEHNLQANISPKVADILIENINQHNESNIGFLYRLVRLYGGVLKPTHSRLLVLSDEKGTNTQDEDIEAIELNLEDISNISYSCKKTAKFRSVQANYQDTDNGEIKTITIGDGEPVNKLSYLYENEQTATATAQKVYNSSSLDNDTLNLSILGNPDLISGVPIKINGLRDDIPQNWYIKTASHTISKSGYSTSLQLTLKEV